MLGEHQAGHSPLVGNAIRAHPGSMGQASQC